MKARRSNIGRQHVFLKPLPCSIKSLLKRSDKGKVYTYRRTISGTRYKQYCRSKKIEKSSLPSPKFINKNEKPSLPSPKFIKKNEKPSLPAFKFIKKNEKPSLPASKFMKGNVLQGYKVVTIRSGAGRKKVWRKIQ